MHVPPSSRQINPNSIPQEPQRAVLETVHHKLVAPPHLPCTCICKVSLTLLQSCKKKKRETTFIRNQPREISQKPPLSFSTTIYIQQQEKKEGIHIYTQKIIYQIQMGWSKSEGRCKKHPKHTQSPGVCSSCLRERLSQLSSSNNTLSGSCSSSSPSSSSSASASSESSPPHPLYLSSVLPVSASGGLFGRSRSMAVVAGGNGNGNGKGGVVGNRKKRGGFWSKLLGVSNRRRKEEGLSHSKTMKGSA